VATLGLSAADREAIEAFKRDVIEPSMESLIVLDFWAEWCGPCKALGPTLEKVTAEYAGKGVKLVKINVDEQKMIAAQFRVQSIPTVYALFQGQLVADLTPARTERELKAALDQILHKFPVKAAGAQEAEDLAPLIAMGEEALEGGDAERALSIFTQIAEIAPDEPAVIGGHARALVQLRRLDEAEALLGGVDEKNAGDPAIARARAAASLAREAKPVADSSALAARIAANPDDLDARFALADAEMAAGHRDAAADALLEIIARDRDWNEGAARTRLLTLFEAVGISDPWVSAQRRRLSAVLFT
jgi:putative thioredoxin